MSTSKMTWKRALFFAAGMLWLLFAFGFGCILFRYLAQGSGLQSFAGLFSSGSVLVGLVHVTGFAIAILLCSAIGIYLLARSWAGSQNDLR